MTTWIEDEMSEEGENGTSDSRRQSVEISLLDANGVLTQLAQNYIMYVQLRTFCHILIRVLAKAVILSLATWQHTDRKENLFSSRSRTNHENIGLTWKPEKLFLS